MFSLYLIFDPEHDGYQRDPIYLELSYMTHREASSAVLQLEPIYGKGRIVIVQAQEYAARMGRL